MADRALPPADIAPLDFFTTWVPSRVAEDERRRSRLVDTEALLEFVLLGEGGGIFTVQVARGEVRGWAGGSARPDLRIELELETWRRLNAGELSAPDAFLRRKVRLEGNLSLAVKLHLIIG